MTAPVSESALRRITSFVFISRDGYFEGPTKGDISWHRHGPEEREYSLEALGAGNILLFGRVTYELMARYWPTLAAFESDPLVAEAMNGAEKIVFSRTLKRPAWANTSLVRDNIEDVLRIMKATPGKDMTLLGSGSILTQLSEQGLIDEYRIMEDPVVLGAGTPIFKGIRSVLSLKPTGSRAFKSGVVLHSYQPLGMP